MLRAFKWHANYYFTVKNGGICKNEIFSNSLSKIFNNCFFVNDNFLGKGHQSLSHDKQNINPPPIMQN